MKPVKPASAPVSVRTQIGICVALVVACLTAFWPVFECGFVRYDDPGYVIDNPMVRQGFTVGTVSWAFTTFDMGYWQPLTWLSFMLDWMLFGPGPVGFHAVNLCLHVLNTLLLFWLLSRITEATWRSAFVAALFALHPLHVESVAWISERKSLLSTLFALLAIMAYARAVECEKTAKSGSLDVRNQKLSPATHVSCSSSFWFLTSRFYLLSLCLFACSLMSKPMLVTFPFVLLLLDYWPLQRFPTVAGNQRSVFSILVPPLRIVLEKVPFLLLSALVSVMAVLGQKSVGALHGTASVPLEARLGNVVFGYLQYIRKTVWPDDLAAFYPFIHWTVWETAAAVLILGLTSTLVLRTVSRRPYLAVGWLWFLGTLVPVIGLIQVGRQSMADRYSYIPFVGLFIIVSWGLGEWARPAEPCGTSRLSSPWRSRCRIAAVAALLVLGMCGVVTSLQVRHWKDARALWTHALAVTKDNPVAHAGLASVLEKESRFGEAEAHLRAAIRIAPENTATYNNLAKVLIAQGKFKEAEAECLTALRLSPDDALARNNLGIILDKQGKWNDAAARYIEALQLNPDLAVAHFNLAESFVRQERFAEAEQHYRAGLLVQLDDVDVHQRFGMVLLKQGKTADAITHWREAVRLEPGAFELLNNLAWILATHPEANIRNGAEAVELAEAACRLSSPVRPELLGTLAAAYAEAGRFEDALRTQQKAIDAAAQGGDGQLAGKLRQRLQIYQSHQPYRETR